MPLRFVAFPGLQPDPRASNQAFSFPKPGRVNRKEAPKDWSVMLRRAHGRRHSGAMRQHRTTDAQLRIGDSRDCQESYQANIEIPGSRPAALPPNDGGLTQQGQG
jgi:hypothetical protein